MDAYLTILSTHHHAHASPTHSTGFMSVNLRHDDMIVEAYGMDPAAPLYTTTIPLEMTPEGF